MSALLQAADLVCGYADASVLHGVTVEVLDNGFVGILGPNGSGKTTLLRALAGTIRPTRGRVTLDGVDLSRLPRLEIARRMAVVPQDTHLAFDYTALEIVLMGRYPHLTTFEIEGPADIELAREALTATGTRALEARQFATLSGGEKQRVIIAAALAQIAGGAAPDQAVDSRPGILLLDEPTAALDLAYQLEVATLLRDLQRRRPLSIVVSTHDLNFAAALCRSLLLLKDGQVIACGATRDVLTPEHIAALYGVEADVHYHERAGHLVVVPVQRSAERRTP